MWPQYIYPIIALILSSIILFIIGIKHAWLQYIYPIIALILSAIVLFIIGILVFKISRRFSYLLFNQRDSDFIDIIFAGVILVALSQLFGPLVATTYPIILGPDASDYRISFESIYYNISHNNTANNYTISATSDSLGEDYHVIETSTPIESDFVIHNKILATNLNPLMNFEDHIFLSIYNPGEIRTFLSRPIIKVNQSADLIIQFIDSPINNLYPITVRGISEDGRIREAMMVIAINYPQIVIAENSTFITGTPNTSDFIRGTPILGGGTVYSTGGSAVYTPTNPINIALSPDLNYNISNESSKYSTNFEPYAPNCPTNFGTYTPSYPTNFGTYTPSYPTNLGTFTPSYRTNSGIYTPGHSGITGSVLYPTAYAFQ